MKASDAFARPAIAMVARLKRIRVFHLRKVPALDQRFREARGFIDGVDGFSL